MNSVVRVLMFGCAVMLFAGCATAQYARPDQTVSLDDMKATVNYLTAMQPPRSFAFPESLNNAADYIARKLTAYGLNPERQYFDVLGDTFVNIVASVGPRQGKRLIVGAHYDVCGNQPGADDNASAIAGLLEIARFAKQHEADLRYGIDFVAYSLEEPPYFGTPHMGSFAHAQSLKRNNVPVYGMICLESIGYFTDAENSQRYPSALLEACYPSTGNFIAVVSDMGSISLAKQVAEQLAATEVDVQTLHAPSSLAMIDFSDHRNYWMFGFDAIMITDTALLRNPNYHRGSDTPTTLSYDKMGEVVRGICWAILNLK